MAEPHAEETFERVRDAVAGLTMLVAGATPDEWIDFLESIRLVLHSLHPLRANPVDFVRWVPKDLVRPNDYNPNAVAPIELELLYKSIFHDGYTQPIVVIFDPEQKLFIVVDGFHRYYVLNTHPDILDRCRGRLPIVVLDKDINDRMASTVRHNRARGKHSVKGMSAMVFKMLAGGWPDERICNELGMNAEELVRLKHITGFSKLFDAGEFSHAWKTERQIRIEAAYKQEHADDDGTGKKVLPTSGE